jgi:hypothetical protein
MKMSKSEAGKLGAKKSKITCENNKTKRIIDYNLSPVCCLHCNTSLSYEKRKNKFCSYTCAGIYNNSKKNWFNIKTGPISKKDSIISEKNNIKYKNLITNKVVWNCLSCDKEYITSEVKAGKFCNRKCQTDYQYKESINNWDTITPGRRAIKKFLAETFGKKCSICSISSWNEKEIVLELEHKDGNSQNNSKDNLCLICPNCHSQTTTYKAKNKGNGRYIRRKRYAEGRSY